MKVPPVLIVCCLLGCSSGMNDARTPPQVNNNNDPAPGSALANITAVVATGDPGAYTFAVTIASTETGCDRYADWWEVVSDEGELLYRRILAHSHVDEQPFTRSGGPVAIAADQRVIVRAHFNVAGQGAYGGDEFAGTVATGFSRTGQPAELPANIETAPPQPTDCAF